MAEHIREANCWCKPTVIPVERNDGTIGYVYGHNEDSDDTLKQVERCVQIFQAMDTVKRQGSENG